MKIINKLLAVMSVAALFLCSAVNAFAEELPDGSVKGLPENLVILDNNGDSPHNTGEYYFEVLDMQQGTTYTKNIQVMNLRGDDKSIHVYFTARPLTNEGEIDLENECKCDVYLDDNLIYNGKVTGEGTPDIRDDSLDLGVYTPGQARKLKVDIVWNGTDAGSHIDNGARTVTASGTEITRTPSGKTHISGRTTFKWIFYAHVEKADNSGTSEPSEPSEEISDSSKASTVSEPTYDDSDTSTESAEPSEEQQTSVIVVSDISVTSHSGGNPEIKDVVKTGEIVIYGGIGALMVAMLILIAMLMVRSKKKKSKAK